jgi:hypothetical protein
MITKIKILNLIANKYQKIVLLRYIYSVKRREASGDVSLLTNYKPDRRMAGWPLSKLDSFTLKTN